MLTRMFKFWVMYLVLVMPTNKLFAAAAMVADREVLSKSSERGCKTIGYGSYGKVVTDEVPFAACAPQVKKTRKLDLRNARTWTSLKEAIALQALNIAEVRNIPDLLGVQRPRSSEGVLDFEMVFPRYKNYIPKEDIKTDDEKFPQDLVARRNFLKNLAGTLATIHSFDMAHEDIKPANVLYDERKSRGFILADFGAISISTRHPSTWHKTSPGVRSPEKVDLEQKNNGLGYPKESDIWALFVTYMRIFYDDDFLSDGFYHGVSLDLSHFEMTDSERHLLNKMSDLNPDTRIKAAGILLHPFVRGELAVTDSSEQENRQEKANIKERPKSFFPSSLSPYSYFFSKKQRAEIPVDICPVDKKRRSSLGANSIQVKMRLWRSLFMVLPDNVCPETKEAYQIKWNPQSRPMFSDKVEWTANEIYPILRDAKFLEKEKDWVFLIVFALLLNDLVVNDNNWSRDDSAESAWKNVPKLPNFGNFLALYVHFDTDHNKSLTAGEVEAEFVGRFFQCFDIIYEKYSIVVKKPNSIAIPDSHFSL